MVLVQGIAASPGIAIGETYHLLEQEINIEDQHIEADEVEQEIARLHQALEKVKEEFIAVKEYIADELGQEKSRIFKAHIMFLNDPELIPAIEDKIKNQQLRAEKAVDEIMDHYVHIFDKMNDEYLRGRKADVRNVGKRIIKQLLSQNGQTENDKEMDREVIIVARDLSPADTARLDRDIVKAFVTAQGSRTSHSAIMARSLGIPAVVGVGEELLKNCNQGDPIIVDGNQGEIIVNPSREILKKYHEKAKIYREHQQELLDYRDKKAVTRDDKRVEVVGNIGEPGDVEPVLEQGGEGIGLFRTEFLYMNRNQLPDEEEQFQVYRDVVEKMGQKPVIIRTLDIGGGKNLPYLELTEEENPFLGYRAIRISLENPEMFKEQLRALLRAAVYGNIKIMYPMISSLDELASVQQLFSEACNELAARGEDFDQDIEIGIMIEIPSTLLIAGELAREVDFFSIGTNDLIQYMMAVDRNNEKIAKMHTPYHPAVLRFVKQIVEIAHQEEIWVGMCGEAAGDELLLPFLVGIGIDELSMSAVSILKTKNLLKKWDSRDAQKVVDNVLTMSTEKEIKNYLVQCSKEGLFLGGERAEG